MLERGYSLMPKLKLVSYILVSAMALSYSVSQASGQSNRSDLSNQKIIAERTNKIGVKSVIAVDQDGVVREIDFGLKDVSGPKIFGNLGVQVTQSGNVNLASVLPKDKVATLTRRITLDDGSHIHVVVAWGFSSIPVVPDPYCSLYIYREYKGRVDEIFSEKDLGTELNQFVVEDINDDGKIEILFTVREASIETMWVYQIEPEGQIKGIQRIDGYYVHTIADRWLNGDAQV